MSTVKSTSNEINLSGLVGKPATQVQKDTVSKIVNGLDQASASAVIRLAIALSQVERGHRPKSTEPKVKSEFVTENQANRIAKHFGEAYNGEAIFATKMPYDTAYAIYGAIIAKPADEAEISKQQVVLDEALADNTE